MSVCMNPSLRFPSQNWDKALVGKRLTDRKIAQYAKSGFYSLESMAARREFRKNLALRRKGQKQEAPSNFFYGDDDRLIYSPK